MGVKKVTFRLRNITYAPMLQIKERSDKVHQRNIYVNVTDVHNYLCESNTNTRVDFKKREHF